jgi:hypothetical protein
MKSQVYLAADEHVIAERRADHMPRTQEASQC